MSVDSKDRDKMGEVIATLRVMPESMEIDLEALKNKLKEKISVHAEVHKIVEVPIAFGMKALNVMTVIPEQDGLLEEVETAAKETEGVSEVDMVDVRRAL